MTALYGFPYLLAYLIVSVTGLTLLRHLWCEWREAETEYREHARRQQ